MRIFDAGERRGRWRWQMDGAHVDVAVRELRQILAAPRTSPEWRWNARRRLAAARAALGAAPVAGPVPTQPTGAHDAPASSTLRRLDLLETGVLDDLDAGTIEREVGDLLEQLTRDA